jgi:peptide/nickel transport system substrate-binding protein
MKALYICGLVMLVSGLLLVPCAQAAAAPSQTPESPQYGGVVKMIANYPPRAIAPLKAMYGGDEISVLFCYESLVNVTKDGSVGPALAESWKTASDGKSITFKLRKGVKFHDGTDFNAAAVKYNLEEQKDVKNELASITSIDVVDEHTVRLNLKQYDNMLLVSLTRVPGRMASPKSLQNPDKQWVSTHMVGTGPFQFVSWERDVALKYKKFEGYWDKGKPYLDGFEVIFIVDSRTASAALQAGEAQMTSLVLAKDLRNLLTPDLRVNTFYRFVYMLAGDSANPGSPFANRKVREAMEYAIDKKAIVDAVGAGTWIAPNQVCIPGTVGWILDFKGRQYDAKKAKQLLAEAGYANGFKTTLIAQSNIDRDALVATQTYLKAVGIDANLSIVDTGRMGVYQSKGWQNAILACAMEAIPQEYLREVQRLFVPGSSSRLHSVGVPPEFNDVVKQATGASDHDAQRKLTERVVRMFYDEAVVVPVWIDSANGVYHKNVYTDYKIYHKQNWNPADCWIRR